MCWWTATGVGPHSGGLSTREGHAAGAERIIDFLGWCADLGIPQVTLYMLSTENLKRPADELTGLIAVIDEFLQRLHTAQQGPVHALVMFPLFPTSFATPWSGL